MPQRPHSPHSSLQTHEVLPSYGPSFARLCMLAFKPLQHMCSPCQTIRLINHLIQHGVADHSRHAQVMRLCWLLTCCHC